MYKLIDTFNNKTISTHRKLINAVKAQARHARRFTLGAYIPTKIDGVSYNELIETENELFNH